MGAGAPVSPLSAGSLAQLTLSLLFIVGLIFAISWLIKRFRIAVPHGRGEMSVIGEVAVGPRERVVLIRVGDTQVLIGVGTGGVVALTPLATPIALKPAQPAPVFADRLRELMKRPGGGA
jgi:flagellar protein FliO/FliZ